MPEMADILAAPQQAASTQAAKDEQFRTLGAISVAHWVSHFHIFVLPMLFPFLKQQLNVGYIELGFALTVFAVSSGLTQAPIGCSSAPRYWDWPTASITRPIMRSSRRI
jgi:hypothetical protein